MYRWLLHTETSVNVILTTGRRAISWVDSSPPPPSFKPENDSRASYVFHSVTYNVHAGQHGHHKVLSKSVLCNSLIIFSVSILDICPLLFLVSPLSKLLMWLPLLFDQSGLLEIVRLRRPWVQFSVSHRCCKLPKESKDRRKPAATPPSARFPSSNNTSSSGCEQRSSLSTPPPHVSSEARTGCYTGRNGQDITVLEYHSFPEIT